MENERYEVAKGCLGLVVFIVIGLPFMFAAITYLPWPLVVVAIVGALIVAGIQENMRTNDKH